MTTVSRRVSRRLIPLALLAGMLGLALAGGQDRLPVLMYHHLVTDAPASAAELHVDCFERQMRYLHEQGFTTLTLAEFVQFHAEGSFPARSLLITFDDGYRSFLEHAYPLLQAYGFSAVVFPIVGHVPGLQRDVVWSEYLSFHELRRMCAESGLIDVGSHTFGLHRVDDAGRPAVLRQPHESPEGHVGRVLGDLLSSRLVLAQQTDHDVIALAWPFGVHTPEVVDLAVEAGFSLLFTTDEGYVAADTPLTALMRFTVAADAPRCFRDIVDPARQAP